MLSPACSTRFLVMTCLLLATTRSMADPQPAQPPTDLKAAGARNEAGPAAESTVKPAGETPQAEGAAGKGAVFADFDVDGNVDLFVTNLYQSEPKQPQALSEYWIGIDGTPPDDALRAQLELPAGQGLVVNQVVEESPAAKAGLKQYDVLIACQDKPLAEIGDLAKIVDEKKETLLALRLIRGGKRIIVEITPQRRPACQTGETCPSVSKLDDAAYLSRVWLDLIGTPPNDGEVEKFAGDKQEKKREALANRLLRQSTVANRSCTACHADEGVRWKKQILSPYVRWDTAIFQAPPANSNLFVKRLVGLPGALISTQDGTFVDLSQKLPDDFSITVNVKGSEPAKITVKKGNRSWDLNPEELNQLPDDVRGALPQWLTPGQNHVGNMWWQTVTDPHRQGLAGWLNNRLIWNNDDGKYLVLGGPADTPAPPEPAAAALQKMEQQIESLTGQLGELRKAMQDLQESLKAGRTNAGDTKK